MSHVVSGAQDAESRFRRRAEVRTTERMCDASGEERRSDDGALSARRLLLNPLSEESDGYAMVIGSTSIAWTCRT